MATFRGMDGLFVLGGILDGAPLVNGLLAAGATSMNIDAAPTLKGVVFAGDTFTLAGETGSPVHTVSGGPYVAAANAIAGITFTPAIAAGGVADNAAVTFVSNSVAECRVWNQTSEIAVLAAAAMSDKWRRVRGGMAMWSADAEIHLDYGDAKQKALIDKLFVATPVSVSAGLVLRVGSSKQFYGGALASGFRIASGGTDAFFTVQCRLAGDGSLLPNWS